MNKLCYIFALLKVGLALDTCIFTKNQATYDLNAANIGDFSDRLYHESVDPDFPEYKYFFNLCSPVKQLPPFSFCNETNNDFNKGYCKTLNDTTGECMVMSPILGTGNLISI